MPSQRSKVKPEAEFRYRNKYLEKDLSFRPKPDELVVTFPPAASDATAGDITRATGMAVSGVADAGRGFAVLKVPPGTQSDAAAGSVERSPGVDNAIPVLVDDEGLTRYFLPDELTVQFKPEIAKERA